MLRIVTVATRREGSDSLTQDDVVAFLANSFAAHQRRLAGAPDPFPPATVSATLAELVCRGPAGVRASGIWR